ncbi:glycosyltransferase, partial [Akkermansiaceae bacterium]|nr:glycosyltransferase [Akkermansiaceae bacterium]
KFDLTWGHYLQIAGFLTVMFSRRVKIKSVVSARGNDIDQMMFPPGDFARLKWVLEMADFVTSVSSELSEKIKTIIGDDRMVNVIPNAVDPSIFYPDEPDPEIRKSLELNDEELLIGFSGELRHKKGLAFFPNALSEVRKKLSASILIIGEIRARERSKLSAFAAEDPETAERFLNTGHVEDPAEVAKYLRACDMVVQPSVWDGMPNSVLEAMACECLVLASDAGGIPEIIEHEKNGIILPKSELNHLGQAIIETISLDQTTKDCIKKSARSTVLESFSPENEASCLGKLLNLFSV